MKVYIGWSGEVSRQVASVLCAWIPLAVPHAEAFSPENISIGSPWNDTLQEELRTANYGLLCVTKDNVDSQWLSYEAGALSRTDCVVIPFLFDVTPSDLIGPLRMFRTAAFRQRDIEELVIEWNAACKKEGGPYTEPNELQRIFQALYPVLQNRLDALRKARKESPPDTADNLKRDIVAVNRKLDAILSQLARAETKSV